MLVKLYQQLEVKEKINFLMKREYLREFAGMTFQKAYSVSNMVKGNLEFLKIIV